MNMILLFEGDWVESGRRVRLGRRRRKHILQIHRASLGDEPRVGELGGRTGQGRITFIDDEILEMDVVLDAEPPPASQTTLVVALPRPPVLRRLLIAVTSMGIKKIVLLNARSVEKSFWQSRALIEEALFDQCVLGLEQARDTRPPEVWLRPRFKHFVEDELADLLADGTGFLAHPEERGDRLAEGSQPALLAVGPEAGWSDYELAALEATGLERISLGIRALRVETAVPALLARVGAIPSAAPRMSA